MKYDVADAFDGRGSRPPHRGAWIEITIIIKLDKAASVAPRTGGRGLKYAITPPLSLFPACRPPRRGAWIEISKSPNSSALF